MEPKDVNFTNTSTKTNLKGLYTYLSILKLWFLRQTAKLGQLLVEVSVCLVAIMPCPQHAEKFRLRESCHQSATSYRGLHPSELHTGGNPRVLYRGCRLDGECCRECSNLCAAMHFQDEARFLLDPCKAKLFWNVSRALSASSWKRWSSPPNRQNMHENHSFTVPEESNHDLLTETFRIPPPRRLRVVPHYWEIFVSGSKWWTQVSPGVKIRTRRFLLQLQNVPTTRKKLFFFDFMFECEAPRNPYQARLPISRDFESCNTSFADWKNERQLSSCEALIFSNDVSPPTSITWLTAVTR